MVGEIRDLESVMVCIQAALTGHLVLTTLHTNDAASALSRLQDIGVDPYLVGSTVRLVIAQRLVRKLCPHCSVKEMPGAPTLAEARDRATAGGLKWEALQQGFMKPVGCEKCVKTGFRGRTLISETLEVTPRIEQALRAKEPDSVLREIAVSEGMITMDADGVGRAANGETSFNEVARLLSAR
jgi:general secretion pathway protein E